MIRNLLIVAGAGLVLAIVGFAGAAAVGGADVARNGWNWTLYNEGVADERAVDQSPHVERSLAWSGGDRLIIDAPADVVFVQGAEAGVQISGPEAVVNRVRLRDGRLTIDDLVQNDSETSVKLGSIYWNARSKIYAPSDGLQIVVTAPGVMNFELNGSGDLSIRGYDQPSISVVVNGSGDIKADGRAQSAEVAVSGSGDIDLSPMTLEQARASVSGSGEARLGPTQSAELAVSGSGDIVLTREPARTTTDVSGSGRVRRE